MTDPVVDGGGDRLSPVTAGSILVEAGRRLVGDAGTWLLAGLCCWVVIAPGVMGLGSLVGLLVLMRADGMELRAEVPMMVVTIAAALVLVVVTAAALAAQQRLALAGVDGRRPAFRDGFPPRRVLGIAVLVFAGAVVGVLAWGAVALVRPGAGTDAWLSGVVTLVPLVLLYLVAFAPAVMLDRDVGLFRALGSGVRLAFVRPFQWLLVVLAVWVLILLGAALYVGVVVTIPFAVLAVTVAYRRFSGPIPGNA